LDGHPQAAWLLGRRRRDTRRFGRLPEKRRRAKKAPKRESEADKKQLGNALVAWAMLTAIEIEAELSSGSPEHEHTPRHSDLLVKALASLQA
jgi:hypothetical protein